MLQLISLRLSFLFTLYVTSYLAESISLLRDSKSEVDLLTPGCMPILFENNSKIGANC